MQAEQQAEQQKIRCPGSATDEFYHPHWNAGEGWSASITAACGVCHLRVGLYPHGLRSIATAGWCMKTHYVNPDTIADGYVDAGVSEITKDCDIIGKQIICPDSED